MSKQEVIICHNLEENLNKAITQCPHDKLFVLADEHTRKLCIPVFVHIFGPYINKMGIFNTIKSR